MKAFARCRLQGRQGSDLQKRQSPTWDIRLCGEWIRWFVDYHRGIAQQFLSTQIEQSLWRLRRWEFKAHILWKELQREKREHRQVLLQGLQCFIYLFIFSVSGLSLIPLPLPSSKNEKMPCGWGWRRGGGVAIRWKIWLEQSLVPTEELEQYLSSHVEKTFSKLGRKHCQNSWIVP